MIVEIKREHYEKAECNSVESCVLALAIKQATNDPKWLVDGDAVSHTGKDIYCLAPAWFDTFAKFADDWLTPEYDQLKIYADCGEPSGMMCNVGTFEFDPKTGKVGEFIQSGRIDIFPIWLKRLTPLQRSMLKKKGVIA